MKTSVNIRLDPGVMEHDHVQVRYRELRPPVIAEDHGRKAEPEKRSRLSSWRTILDFTCVLKIHYEIL